MQFRLTILASLAFAIASPALAQETKLRVGDIPPALSVDEWTKDDGPSALEANRVYVVEFWATWCGPCRQSIPHLNELHEQFSDKGLTILGITDEKPEVVKPWVQSRGTGMAYAVGIDPDQSMKQAWMEPAGQKGIPSAFIVGKNGKILFIGHPLDPEFDKVVRLALTGRYDPEVMSKTKPIIEAARRAAKVRNWREAYRFFDEAIAVDPKVMAMTAIERYRVQVADEKDVEGAAKYGRGLLQAYAEDPAFLGDLAETIVTDPDISSRDLELAKAAAAAMIGSAGRGDPVLLAKLAAVQFHSGDVDAAVETQMEAWMSASKNDKASFKRQLDAYRMGGRGSSTGTPGTPDAAK